LTTPEVTTVGKIFHLFQELTNSTSPLPAPASAFLSGPAELGTGARLYAALSSAVLDPSDLGAVGRGRAVSGLVCRFNVDGTIYSKHPRICEPQS